MKKFVILLAVPAMAVPNFSWGAFDEDLTKAVTENNYGIQATCQSSGQFTARALEHTRSVRGVIAKLKDNPACKGLTETLEVGLNGAVQHLETISRLNGLMDQNQPQKEQFKSVGQEMQALRTFAHDLPQGQAQAPSFLPASILTALSRSAMKHQRLHTVANGGPDVETNSRRSLTQNLAQKILGYKAELRTAAMSGITILNTSMESVASAQAGCLDSTSSAFIASGFTKMLAAFLTGSEVSAAGQQAATALNKIVNFVARDKKYIDAIRSLNEAEFYTTLSCLVEMTSKGYCDIEDINTLLREIKKDFNIVERVMEPTEAQKAQGAKPLTFMEAEAKNFRSLLSKGPMAGHYVLSHQLPLVTEWINKIQFGVEPQLETEATFQVQAFQTGLQPFIQMKEILGRFNNKRAQLENTQSLAAKQNLVLEMLFLVNDGFTNTRNQGGENFFLRVHPVPRMPFALLGIPYNEMPAEVFIPKNNITMDPQQYIMLNYQTSMPQFKDPDRLAGLIKQNAEEIFKRADGLAQQFFMQFFIPDEVAVVTESMVGMNRGDVRSALAEIDIYVRDFAERMAQPGGDPSFVPLAVDLRDRLGVILAHYKRFHEFALELVEQKADGKLTSQSLQTKMIPMARRFIQDVYDQFYIKTMRAGWLSYRLMLIVKKDYALAMQKRDFSNKELQDLLLATGLESLNQLFNQAGIDFGAAEADIATARDLYWKNLMALEKIAAAPLQNYINENRLRADPNIVTQRDLWMEANRYSFQRHAAKTPTDNHSYQWFRTFVGAANNVVEGLFGGFGLIGKDVRYGWPEGFQEVFNTKLPDLTDTEDGAAQNIWSRNCTVVLAFNNLRPYMYLCQKATFYSPFYDAQKYQGQPQVLRFLKDELSTNFMAKAYAHLDPQVNYASIRNREGVKELINKNRRARICAIRDHYRKNYVMQITAGLKRDNAVYVNEFTRIPERPVVNTEPIVPETPAPGLVSPENPETPPDFPGEQGEKAQSSASRRAR
ncbi:MAG: hypothetical protein ACK5Y2_02935 [Bdellovibrionales bacterium]